MAKRNDSYQSEWKVILKLLLTLLMFYNVYHSVQANCGIIRYLNRLCLYEISMHSIFSLTKKRL
jgi:hypothetical protein